MSIKEKQRLTKPNIVIIDTNVALIVIIDTNVALIVITDTNVALIVIIDTNVFLISSFRRVLFIVCFLLGNTPGSGDYMPTFRNTLSVPSSQAGRCE